MSWFNIIKNTGEVLSTEGGIFNTTYMPKPKSKEKDCGCGCPTCKEE